MKKILLVEDDQSLIEIYQMAFSQAKFGVEVITLGQEAIKKIKAIKAGKAKKPDLVLLDLVLPDMNGIQVLKEIRKQEKAEGLSVFILTNYTSQELERMGCYLKTEKYLLKTDYTPSQLVNLIKERLGN